MGSLDPRPVVETILPQSKLAFFALFMAFRNRHPWDVQALKKMYVDLPVDFSAENRQTNIIDCKKPRVQALRTWTCTKSKQHTECLQRSCGVSNVVTLDTVDLLPSKTATNHNFSYVRLANRL